jgi:hypothetical protein
VARLRTALSTRQGPWGAALLEPEVLLALARTPPVDAAALADVPGVGSALAERWGRVILEALRSSPVERTAGAASPRRLALEAWRRRTARAGGVPEYVVMRDATLEALLTADPRDGRALAAVPGMGPRALAKHGEALLALIAAVPSDGYLLPEDPGASLMAGPCDVTAAGRIALQDFRRGDRRSAERRAGDRRADGSPSLLLTDAERRQVDRRRGDRRR